MAGRAEERAYLAEIVTSRIEGGIIVAGSPGIGKTLLVQEILRSVEGIHTETVTATDLLRLGEHGAASRALEVTSHVVGGFYAAVTAHHAVAVQSGRSQDFMLAANAFSALGCSLITAELWALTSHAYEREDHRSRQDAASRQGSSIFAACEGARTPLLTDTKTLAVLTRREREVAPLADSGNSNAQIADQLSVTVRTVESHLYSAFAKLGITERSELSEIC